MVPGHDFEREIIDDGAAVLPFLIEKFTASKRTRPDPRWWHGPGRRAPAARAQGPLIRPDDADVLNRPVISQYPVHKPFRRNAIAPAAAIEPMPTRSRQSHRASTYDADDERHAQRLVDDLKIR
jgi:hypothetical protein